MHVWALWLLCETLAASGPPGCHTRAFSSIGRRPRFGTKAKNRHSSTALRHLKSPQCLILLRVFAENLWNSPSQRVEKSYRSEILPSLLKIFGISFGAHAIDLSFLGHSSQVFVPTYSLPHAPFSDITFHHFRNVFCHTPISNCPVPHTYRSCLLSCRCSSGTLVSQIAQHTSLSCP